MVTWDGYSGYYSDQYTGLTSLTLTNYPILRTFSFTCRYLDDSDYTWRGFESLSIHDLPSLETITIGIKTIPNTKYLNIFSKNNYFILNNRFTTTTVY